MNRQQLFAFHTEMTNAALTLMRKKNADYAGGDKTGDDNPFLNFTRCEAVNVCSAETGILTRMLDKFARLATFTNTRSLQVKDEAVHDTCLDLVNYAILFMALVEHRSAPAASPSLPVIHSPPEKELPASEIPNELLRGTRVLYMTSDNKLIPAVIGEVFDARSKRVKLILDYMEEGNHAEGYYRIASFGKLSGMWRFNEKP